MIESLSFTAAQALGLAVAAEPNIRYVSKGGSDAAGNTGSFFQPFLTIAAAVTSIGASATAAQPYAIAVGPGTYTEAFALHPFQFVVGTGPGATILSNVAANWIDATFSAAGTQDAGIIDCTIGANLAADFAAVASPGAGRFFLIDAIIVAGVAFSVTGNNSTNYLHIQNLQSLDAGGGVNSVTNISATLSGNLRGRSMTVTNTAAYAIVVRSNLNLGNALTVSAASTVNTAIVVTTDDGSSITQPFVLTGDGAAIFARAGCFRSNPPDADTQLAFSTFIAGATRGINQGHTFFIPLALTGVRTYTLNTANDGTRCTIVNAAANTLLLAGILAGGISYLDPGESASFIFANGGWRSTITNVHGGKVTLVGGASPFIATDMNANTAIAVSLQDLNGSAAVGIPSTPLAARVNGLRTAGGGFIINSITAAGVAVATDNGIYNWVAEIKQ